MAESSVNNPQLIPPSPTTKFYTNFLYKAILVSIFLLLLPLFPSQAPDFINHTINTTSWELLQLVLVGIAVSYGLFSKRNDDDDDDTHNNTHSYVAGLLQVSSVFDDDSENPSASASHHNNNNTNFHTWNSQYYRGEPIVVVAKESDDATTIEKPLLLPVRSLKKEFNSSFSRSNSRRVPTCRNYSKLTNPGESEEENIVLRSPIPWRSRSGRMEVKEDFSQTPSVHEINPIESSSPSFKRGYQSSKGVSSEEINPSSSSSSEVESKSLEDVGRRNKSPNPPPPPPPPPPPVSYGQVKVNYNNNSGKELRRSVRSIPEKLENRKRSQRGEELMTIRSRSDMSRREKERERELVEEYLSHDKEIERFIERRGSHLQMMEETGKDSEEEEEEEQLQEVACRKNKNCSNGEELTENGVGGPDVDKKADEFIAKFRERIRLQRIASIRRSTAPQTQTQTQIQTGSGR